MADAIATAYVKLIPTFDKSLGKSISKELGAADVKGAGSKAGKQYTSGVESGMSGLKGAVTSKFSAATVAMGNLMSSAITSAVSSAASGISSLMSTAFNGFADYEQLSGGVEKIFDQANISQILNDADRAFEELNMSANDYIASMNQVGATFAQTMGDQKGYDTARIGMKAISDYASGTGRNIQELNDKFALITRSTSSYQSIADQFSGILPATSKDFLEQAKAAGFLSDSYTQLTEVPVAEYQEAVAKMLEKGVDAMGLTGNTAKESFETVSGSISMLKGAWTNFISSLGRKDADFGQIAEDLNMALAAVFDNVIPMLGNIATNVIDNVPMVFSNLGGAIETTLLPQLQIAFSDVMDRLGIKFDETDMANAIEGLSETFDRLSRRIEEVSDAAGPALSGFFSDMGPVIVTVADAVLTVADDLLVLGEGIAYVADQFGRMFADLPGAIEGALGEATQAATAMFQDFANFVMGIPDQIVGFFSGLGEKIMSAIGSISLPSIDLGGFDSASGAVYGASGAVLDKPTLMVAGEAGHEVLLSKRGPILGEFADALSSRMGASQSVTNVYIDGVQALPDTRIYEVACELATAAYDQRRA